MNIIVCIKQVPDTTELSVNPETGTLVREGVPSIMNPDDKAGLEMALNLKSKCGAHVTMITMGPEQAKAVLQEGFAMGADDGYLITDRALGGADTWATSYTLASAIKNIPYDMIITGRQAIDGDTAQVGPQIAEHLGIANVSYVESIEIEDKTIVVKRQFDDRYHMIEVQTPCLISVLSETGWPGNVPAHYDAENNKEPEITVLTHLDLNLDDADIGLKGSPTRVIKSFANQQDEIGCMPPFLSQFIGLNGGNFVPPCHACEERGEQSVMDIFSGFDMSGFVCPCHADDGAEHAIFDFMYHIPGFTNRFEGRDAYMKWFEGYSNELHSADNLRVYKADNGSVMILEYEVHGIVPETGKAYNNRFCSVITLNDRKIVYWRDYMDSLAVMLASS